MDGRKIGGSRSSFERLPNRYSERSFYEHTEDPGDQLGALDEPTETSRDDSNRPTKPKAHRPSVPKSNSKLAHSEAQAQHDDYNRVPSPVKASGTSAWSRPPKNQASSPTRGQSHSSSDKEVHESQSQAPWTTEHWQQGPRAVSGNPAHSNHLKEERFVDQLTAPMSQDRAPEDRFAPALNTEKAQALEGVSQSLIDFLEAQKEGTARGNRDAGQGIRHHELRDQEDLSASRAKPTRGLGLGKGLREREDLKKSRKAEQKDDSDKTQSSVEASPDNSPRHHRKGASSANPDSKYAEGPNTAWQKERRAVPDENARDEYQAPPQVKEDTQGRQSNDSGMLNAPQDAERQEGQYQNPPFMSYQTALGQAGFGQPPTGQQASGNAQQIYKLLEDALRGQGPTLPGGQVAMLGGEAAAGLPPNMQQAISYGSLPPRLPGVYPQNDLEAYANLAGPRRWPSTGGFGSDASSLNAANALAHMLPNIPPNLSTAEHQALLQALQQKYQAHEMEAVANITIQAILSGSASRDPTAAAVPRKRKVGDFFEQPAKRHSSLISEGEMFPGYASGPQQVCAECGTKNTPTWRRHGKRLMCNACGLRRSRSLRSARNAQAGSPGRVHEANLANPGGFPPRHDDPVGMEPGV